MIKKVISFNGDNYRLQLVKNDITQEYELYEDRKIIYKDTNIYWVKVQMSAIIHYRLTGIIYDCENERSIYEGKGKKIFENNIIFKRINKSKSPA